MNLASSIRLSRLPPSSSLPPIHADFEVVPNEVLRATLPRGCNLVARRALVWDLLKIRVLPAGAILRFLCLLGSVRYMILGRCLHRIRDKSYKMNPGEVQVKR